MSAGGGLLLIVVRERVIGVGVVEVVVVVKVEVVVVGRVAIGVTLRPLLKRP